MIVAWLVHLYTASGIVLALLAADAVVDGDYRTAFLYLWAQVVIDATDGVLARAASVSSRLPWFSGTKLDDLVDYATYVFVPALCVARGDLVSGGWAWVAASAMLLSSAFGFSRLDAKTTDHFFTGFPSYWNVVVFYLLVARWTSAVNLAILLGLAVLVFVPFRYVYPSRTPVARGPTNVLGAIWAVQVLVMLWQYPTVPPAALWASLVFPVYYVVLSAAVQMRARQSLRLPGVRHPF